MNQEKVFDVCAFTVLFIPLIFLRDHLPPDSRMCSYVNYYLDGSVGVNDTDDNCKSKSMILLLLSFEPFLLTLLHLENVSNRCNHNLYVVRELIAYF